MTKNLVYPILLVFLIAGCNNLKKHDQDGDSHDHATELSEPDNHDHELESETEDHGNQIIDGTDHEHEAIKIQFTAYSKDFELFAEADPFVVGEMSNVLSHFTHLSNFSALESGKISLKINIDGHETITTLEKPTKKGIYSFNINPELAGKGSIMFIIETEKGNFEISVPDITVYDDEHEAFLEGEHEAESIPSTNTTVFTKEQSWMIDFATEYPIEEAFGQVIKTTAQIKSAPADKVMVSAKTNGIVSVSDINLYEGTNVSKDQVLFTISGKDLSVDNSAVRFAEAQNNFEKAKSDYERSKLLAKDRIISEKDLLADKNKYENTKVIFENLRNNFNASGQMVKSPVTGFINQLYVENGEFVETGQVVLSISKNQSLILYSEIQQKYASILPSVNSAQVRTLHDNKSYSLEDLNGRILSYGRSTNSDNYLIPFSIQIENNKNMITGGFVEIYLKSVSTEKTLSIPNSALLEEQGVYFVFVQITPELFEKREVKPGSRDGFRTEVLKGISKEDRIVIRGAIPVKLAKGTGALDAHSGHVH